MAKRRLLINSDTSAAYKSVDPPPMFPVCASHAAIEPSSAAEITETDSEMENANANCNNAADVGLMDKVCYGCKKPIEDQFHLHVSPNLDWHVACLACSECSKPLDENCTCFLHEGQPYCRRDYIRLFGLKCSLCSEQIPGTELVMRAKAQIFHPQCFCCCACERKLLPGEQFVLNNGRLFCKADFDSLPSSEMAPSPTETANGNDGSSNASTESMTTSSTTSSSRTKRPSSENKGPRVRTVLSEQQLQTLRTVYSSNPRPDALLKEHLVEITGLSPRVIRVWFQNKRCKDKKKILQAEAARMQQQAIQSGTGKVMPPLTPQPPLTPDSMGQISPHTGMSAFTYPPAPSSYEQLTTLPTTPTQVTVSPMVTYQHSSAWGSPTENSVSPFEQTADFSSPMTTEHQQSFIYSSAGTAQHSPYF